jgi:dihydrofolate reductase
MRKLVVFNHVSLDGYFVDANGSMNWAKMAERDKEWNDFVAENASGDGALVFGRKTYELMIQYWPTPMAAQHDPVVAERMNAMRKFVVSKALEKATWNNTTLLKGDVPAEIRKLKNEAGEGLCILGSGMLVARLAEEKLIDEFQVVVNPVALGKGRTMFEGAKEKIGLKLTKTRAFKNGCVYLCYEPA